MFVDLIFEDSTALLGLISLESMLVLEGVFPPGLFFRSISPTVKKFVKLL